MIVVRVLREHTRPGTLASDALRVVVNAYGTKPRHTQGRNGGCREDCIPCGIAALAWHFPDNGIAARVAKQLARSAVVEDTSQATDSGDDRWGGRQ